MRHPLAPLALALLGLSACVGAYGREPQRGGAEPPSRDDSWPVAGRTREAWGSADEPRGLSGGWAGEPAEVDLGRRWARALERVRWFHGEVARALPEAYPAPRLAPEGRPLGGSLEALGLVRAELASHDFGPLEGVFLTAPLLRDGVLEEPGSGALAAELGGWRGGPPRGVSEVLRSGTLAWAIDAKATLFLRAASVELSEDELAEAWRPEGPDDSGLFFALGVAFGL